MSTAPGRTHLAGGFVDDAFMKECHDPHLGVSPFAERLSDLDDQRLGSWRHPASGVQTTVGKVVTSTFC